jgi:primosomal protein N' (replication factor Y)
MELHPGQAVWVPFGAAVAQGVVVELTDRPGVEPTREILGTITERPLLLPHQIALARWISERYLCPLFDAISPMLPPGFEQKLVTYLRPRHDGEGLPALGEHERSVFEFIRARGRVETREVEGRFGKAKAAEATAKLTGLGLVARSREAKSRQVKPKTVPYVRSVVSGEAAEEALTGLRRRRAGKQAGALEYLREAGRAVPIPELTKAVGCSRATVTALEEKGLVSVTEVRVRREPLRGMKVRPVPPPEPTPAQRGAYQRLEEYCGRGTPSVFLLFGVTGSGKTELYIRALEKTVASGRKGICLVPEIALTPQTIERFAARFPGRVAVLHSGLSPGEQFDEWHALRDGQYDVVVGARSALFAPISDVGLIIIDEEHEWAYKQEDASPRYHAREVAIELARLQGAAVILGSATPAVETFYKTQRGEFRLLELPERIGPGSLPRVELVDLRQELRAGNVGLFSRALVSAMRESLGRGEQVVLFLNRRGTATFVQCARCRHVFRCPRCSIALTYHSAEGVLRCHRCHYTMRTPRSCPRCGGGRLRFLGIGTQRVEQELGWLFPGVRALRWDSDAVRTRYGHERFLSSFREHRADVLIGTQMVAKGLDMPEVTLAGVISADMGLNFPDFRAGERTFQLLCQVAGRAGRGAKPGRVIIQTYSPENYAIRAAAGHDYRGFYQREIAYRRRYRYPPFTRLVRLVYVHKNEDACRREAERLRALLEEKGRKEFGHVELIGPLPAFAARVRGRYRWQILLRGGAPTELLEDVALPQGWTVDVDPMGML